MSGTQTPRRALEGYPPGRAALVVGHAGHELCVHGWVEQAQPLVCVLTDGSGSSGRPRIAHSAALLERAGARAGSLFGRYSDKQVYAALLRGELGLLLGWAAELASELLQAGVEYVVADPRDGYNPAHDLCRLMVDAVVCRVGRSGRPLRNYSLALRGMPAQSAGPVRYSLRLDDQSLERKIGAALAYGGLQHEVASALETTEREALRIEELFAVPSDGWPVPVDRPYYETFGEGQVAAGAYSEVLRYARHVQPFERLLADGAF